MSYATGTATDPNDLLQKLVTFLVANGWTQDSSVADGTGWRAHLHRSGVYVNLKSTVGAVQPWTNTSGNVPLSTMGGLHLYLGTSYNSGAGWSVQAGGPVPSGQANVIGCSMQINSGAVTSHHFFANDSGDNITVVVERTTGVFHHLGWGVSLTKAGTWTGGPFFFGSLAWYQWAYNSPPDYDYSKTSLPPCTDGDQQSCVSAYVRADVDAFTGKWISLSGQAQATYGYTGKAGTSGIRGTFVPSDNIPHYQSFDCRSYSSMTQSAILLPIRAFAVRDAGGYSLLGTVPRVFRTQAALYGLSAGTEITVGPDTYKLFPMFAVQKS